MKPLQTIIMSSYLFFFIISCSSSQSAINYSYQNLSKSRQDPYTEVYEYKYRIGKGEWSSLNIFVYNSIHAGYASYTINIGSNISFSSMQQKSGSFTTYQSFKSPSTFQYNDNIKSRNFYYTWEPIVETVSNLQEAIELALNIYLQREIN